MPNFHTGRNGGTGDWRCTVWVLPSQAQMHQRAGTRVRGQHAMSRTPRYKDSERYMKPDSNWKPAKPPAFLKGWYFWVGEEIPVAAFN